jgi:hypothetical protein
MFHFFRFFFTFIGSASHNYDIQVCLDPELTFESMDQWLLGWLDLCRVYFSCLGSRLGIPAKG